MKKYLYLSALFLFLVSGCKKEVKCSDSETQKIIKSELLNNINSSINDTKVVEWIDSNLLIKLDMIQDISRSDNKNYKSCQARLSISFPKSKWSNRYKEAYEDKRLESILCKYDKFSALSCNGDTVSTNIVYDVALTEDEQEHIVKVASTNIFSRDHGSLIALVPPACTMGEFSIDNEKSITSWR